MQVYGVHVFRPAYNPPRRSWYAHYPILRLFGQQSLSLASHTYIALATSFIDTSLGTELHRCLHSSPNQSMHLDDRLLCLDWSYGYSLPSDTAHCRAISWSRETATMSVQPIDAGMPYEVHIKVIGPNFLIFARLVLEYYRFISSPSHEDCHLLIFQDYRQRLRCRPRVSWSFV